MKLKRFNPTFIVSVFGITVVTFLLYQQFAWKTFQDQEIGISLKTPKDWQVKTYDGKKALFVYDSFNREVITMQTQDPGSEVNCRRDFAKIKSYPLGDKQVNLDLSYDCLFSEIVRVKTAVGREYYFNFRFINIGQSDKEKAIEFLKTIKGLVVF